MNFVQTKIYSVSQSVKNLAIQSENKEKDFSAALMHKLDLIYNKY